MGQAIRTYTINGKNRNNNNLKEGYWENNQIVKDKLLIQGNKKY